MKEKSLEELLAEHPFFGDMAPEQLRAIAACGKNVRMEPGNFVFREGELASGFFLVRHGRVQIEIFGAGRGTVPIQILGPGEIIGWSWLIPPHLARFDARTLEPTVLIDLDGPCLRGKCEKDPKLGFEVVTRLARVMAQRLEATRLQLMDLYGLPSS